jgi:hypothetical protein
MMRLRVELQDLIIDSLAASGGTDDHGWTCLLSWRWSTQCQTKLFAGICLDPDDSLA